MSAKPEEITKTDIVQPKNALKKVGKILANGAGGILQEGISTSLTKVIPNPKMQPVVAGVQILAASIISGMSNNEWSDAVLAGISAGAAKDATKSVKSMLPSIGLLSGSKPVENKAKIIGQNAYQSENEDFF